MPKIAQSVGERLGKPFEVSLACYGHPAMNVRSGSSAQIAATSNPPQIPLADVLNRAGHEMVQLAWLLEHLQCNIAPHLQEAAARDANILHQVQSFDHIGQKATALADFLAALAQAVPRRWLVDAGAAAQAVTLADLSSRLGFAGEEKDSSSTGWGDCELF